MTQQEPAGRGKPRVVIGIPTYNRSARLRRCIDSALAQTYPELEIIVSDNASPDDTEAVCRAYAARDARLTYHRQPENVGATRNFLSVFARADAPLYMWLADDDWIAPDYVERCVALLEADPDAVLAGGLATYDGSTAAPSGNVVDCRSASPLMRVLGYYRQVDDNAIFYGVLRHEVAARADVCNVIGGDWLYVAALAFHGHVRTDPAARIHRERGGQSVNKRHLAAALGQPAWMGRVPVTFSLCFNATADVLGNRGYASAPAGWRWLLAALLPFWIVAFKPGQEIARRWRARRARG